MTAKYDAIGVGYAARRRADPRLAARIAAALGSGRVVNVGAGAGSYEPAGTVAAVEPSAVMVGQRPGGAAPAVRAVAEALPLATSCADAGLAVLTVHHWTDPAAGLAEMVRVAPARTVVVCWDRPVTRAYWLFRDYLPEVMAAEAELPDDASVTAVLAGLGRRVRSEVLPLPRDCTDGTAAAFWCRPAAYLEPDVWRSMSGIAQLDPAVRDRGLGRLRDDLADGTWERRNADLAGLDELDVGFRLVVAEPR